YSADGHRRLMSEIVAGVQASAANVSKLVTSLERDGYVRRSANDSDKRRVWVELLPAGVTAVERALPRVARHIAGIWQGLSRDEKRVLVHLLAKLRLDIFTRSAERHVGDVSIT